MTERRWSEAFESLGAFYQAAYGQHLTATYAFGSLGGVMLEARQSAGDWSDAPTPDLTIGWMAAGNVGFSGDLGAGRFSGVQRPGDTILIAPDAGNSIQMEGAHLCRVVALPYLRLRTFVGDSDTLPVDGDFGRLHAGLLRQPQLTRMLAACWREAEAGGPSGTLWADGAVLQLVSVLAQTRANLPNMSRGGLASWQERRTIEYLHGHLAEDVAIEQLASVAHLSTFHFARSFKQSTGLAPHAYLRRLRCEQAKGLLTATDLPVTEIAPRVGYETPQAFARMFRAEVGVSPSKYRRERRS